MLLLFAYAYVLSIYQSHTMFCLCLWFQLIVWHHSNHIQKRKILGIWCVFSAMLMIGHILTNFRKKAWSRFSLIMHWRQLLRQCINSFVLIVFCKGLKLSVDFKSEVTETYYFAYFCLCCLCLHMLMFYLSIYHYFIN